jgi:uridylate kinase
VSDGAKTDPSSPQRPFKRVLLKVSGEALMGDQPYGIDMTTADRIAGKSARRSNAATSSAW